MADRRGGRRRVMTETAKDIASDMEDDIATISDLAFALQLIGRSPGLRHDHEGRAIERLAVKIQEHARTLERQRREAAGQTGA
jgi:hypothetical protein